MLRCWWSNGDDIDKVFNTDKVNRVARVQPSTWARAVVAMTRSIIASVAGVPSRLLRPRVAHIGPPVCHQRRGRVSASPGSKVLHLISVRADTLTA